MHVKLYSLAIYAVAAVSGCSKAATYGTDCSVPLVQWKTPKDGYGHLMMHNVVHIDRTNGLTWNGVRISRKQLDQFLTTVPTLNPVPELTLQVDPNASCSEVSEIRHLIDRKLECRESRLCGEGVGDWDANSRKNGILTLDKQSELGRYIDRVAESASRKSPRTGR